MALARVELKGNLSHSARGRVFKKGQPQIMSDAADILYYQQQSGFHVVMLEQPKAKASSATDEAPEPTPEATKYTEADLKKMNKAQLVEVSAKMSILADEAASKADIIEAILADQS